MGGGRQLHDTTFSCSSQAFDAQLLQKVLDMKPASLEVDASLLESISKHTPLPPLYTKIQQDSAFDSLSQELRTALGGYIVDLRVSDTATVRAEKLALVRLLTAKAEQKPIRALCHCDLSAEGSSTVISTGGIVGDLVDSGAQSVILHTEIEPIDLDVCREVVEEALYLDCAGDPIKQRLGLHVPFLGQDDDDAQEVLQQAAELGVTHFSASVEHMQTVADNTAHR